MSDNNQEITETILDPAKTMNRCWDMVKSAQQEILIILSTPNAYIRQEKIGSMDILKELSSKRKDLKIRLLVPKSDYVDEVRPELKKSNIDLKYIQEFSQTKISILIVDRKSSIVVELNNDGIDPLSAIGYSIFSTRVKTVLS